MTTLPPESSLCTDLIQTLCVTVPEEILRRERRASATECRKILCCHCSPGTSTRILEPPYNQLIVDNVYPSIHCCDHLGKLLGPVCGLGTAQEQFKEQMAARQDHLEEKVVILRRHRKFPTCHVQLVDFNIS